MTTTINVDVERLLNRISGQAGAPTYRAVLETAIRAGFHRGPHDKPSVVLYKGRSRVSQIAAGSVVIIDTSPVRWWRVTTSVSAEPTPLRCATSGQAPHASEKVTEAMGLVIYQTTASLVGAATYQHERGRADLALGMLHTAIILRAKNDKTLVSREAEYQRFRKTAALALNPGTEGERLAALGKAVRVGTKLAMEDTAS